MFKVKRLLKLAQDFEETKNIDKIITSYKPPIFWKEKDLVKQQIKSWKLVNIKKLLYNINNIELLIKRTPQHSKNILSDFLLEIST